MPEPNISRQRAAAEDLADQPSHIGRINNASSSAIVQVSNGTYQKPVPMRDNPTKQFGQPPNMTESEARQCIDSIKGHWNSIRALVLELKERCGWEALGYPNLTACLEAEFSESRTKLLRELKAAEIEKTILQVPVGTCPASHFRPLSQLKPVQYKLALDKAQELAGNRPLTAALISKAVRQIVNSTQLLAPAEISQFQPGELIWIKCRARVSPLQKRWDGCWGIMRSTGSSVQVLVGNQEVEYQASDLQRKHNSDERFFEICERVMALWQTRLEAIEQMLLKELQSRQFFTDLEIQLITCMEAQRFKEKNQGVSEVPGGNP